MADTRVLIVGSGVAGAAVAAALLARGVAPVTMLEAGPRIPMRERRRWLDHLLTGALPYDGCRDDAGYTPLARWLHNSRLLARGGSTLHWGGWSLRLKPEDFALRSATGRGADWPFPYAELEPWYGEAERFLGVAGAEDSVSPPRSTALPFPAIPFTRVDGELIRGLDALGHSYGHMPIARNVSARAGRPACQTVGTCRYCPIGARYTADETLDRLEQDPRFSLVVDAAVRSLRMARRDRVAGVEYVDGATGETRRVDAEFVVLCAGALETPKLLLASAGPDWPDGVGNAAGHLGRHLAYHPLLYARGVKAGNPDRVQQELDFPTLCTRHFDSEAEQARGKLFAFLPQVAPRLDLAARMRAGDTAADLRRAAEGRFQIEVQGFVEMPAGESASVGLARDGGRFGLPGTAVRFEPPESLGEALRANIERLRAMLAAAGFERIESGVYPARGDHAIATCRAAPDPAAGVTGPDLRVHGVGNLYACSNAVFPSAGAVNPTLTLAALALRLGASLAAG